MRSSQRIIIYFVLIFLSVNISSFACDHDDDGKVETEIPAEDFLKLDIGKDTIILDVRTPAEYEEGHLENAIMINIRSDEAYDKIDTLDKNKTYFVYCRSGKRSSRAVEYMRKNNFTKSFNISGGLLELQEAGVDLVH